MRCGAKKIGKEKKKPGRACLCFFPVTLHSSLMHGNLLVGVESQHQVKNSMIKHQRRCQPTHRGSLFVFPQYSFSCQALCQKEERQRFGFRAKTLSDSCFLCFDLQAYVHSLRINHFRLSKQFPIIVSIFRFLYGGEKSRGLAR